MRTKVGLWIDHKGERLSPPPKPSAVTNVMVCAGTESTD